VSKNKPLNLAASVRQRLLTLSRQRGEEHNLVLTRYAIERLLYRLSKSPHADKFVLKGAMLFSLWTNQQHRPTRDLDLLGRGVSSADELRVIFTAIFKTDVEPDGLRFDPDTMQISEIREDQEYQGLRVRLHAFLGNARIGVQVDVGFGDAVVPAAERATYPTLLEFPAPNLRIYPREAVVTEKFHAMVALGMFNSRLKDFFDIWTMAREFPFNGAKLRRAILATFDRRRTAVPTEEPIALSDEFARSSEKITQWQGFLRSHGLETIAPDLAMVVADLIRFLMPPVLAVSAGEDYDKHWPPGGPWEQQPTGEYQGDSM